MTPEQRGLVLRRQLLFVSVVLVATSVSAQYVINHQGKALKKTTKAFRAMADVAALYEEFVPPHILATGNEMLAFAQIEMKFDE